MQAYACVSLAPMLFAKLNDTSDLGFTLPLSAHRTLISAHSAPLKRNDSRLSHQHFDEYGCCCRPFSYWETCSLLFLFSPILSFLLPGTRSRRSSVQSTHSHRPVVAGTAVAASTGAAGVVGMLRSGGGAGSVPPEAPLQRISAAPRLNRFFMDSLAGASSSSDEDDDGDDEDNEVHGSAGETRRSGSEEGEVDAGAAAVEAPRDVATAAEPALACAAGSSSSAAGAVGPVQQGSVGDEVCVDVVLAWGA